MIASDDVCDSVPIDSSYLSVQSHMSWLKVKLPQHCNGTKEVAPSSSSCSSSSCPSVPRSRGDSDAPVVVHPWTLQCIEGRGYCAFSNHRYKAGDLILTESPTVWVQGHHPFSPLQILEIDRKVSLLAVEDRNAFLDMSNVYEEMSSISAGIFMTNSFDMAGRSKFQGVACGMYLALARLNHSCVPNVQQSHVPLTGEEVLYASRDIEIGDEVCDCYIDLRQSKENRRKELLDNFRFHCGCAACSLGEYSSEERSSAECSTECSFQDCSIEGDVRTMVVDHSNNESNLFESIGNNSNNNNSNSNNNNDKDDYYRQYSHTFEDISIDQIIADNTPLALITLYNGLNVLEMECSLKWSVRYLSSAHLSVYQILNKLNSDDNGDNNDYSGNGSNGNNGNNNGYNGHNNEKKRNRNEDTSEAIEHSSSDTHSLEYSSPFTTHHSSHLSTNLPTPPTPLPTPFTHPTHSTPLNNKQKMRYHLERAHHFNLLLQGPSTPDSCSTKKLMRKHKYL